MKHPRALGFALLAAFTLGAGACSTKRSITIQSDPPGARVWVDGKERGKTPYTLPFVHYGDAEVRLEKEGYKSYATVVRVPTKIDGYPLIDLPFELTVKRRCFQWKATLEKLGKDPSDADVQQLLDRATAFRARTKREAVADAATRPLVGERRPCPEAVSIDDAPRLVRPVGGGR